MTPLWHPSRAFRLTKLFFFLLLSGLVAGCSGSGGSDLSFATEYQAVFLDNGQVFFGKLGDAGSVYLSLHDVYFVQRQQTPDQKEAKNLLVRLGSEWHAPDFMRINTRHIVFIEPVAPDSRVAKLIREAKKLPPAAPPAPAAGSPGPASPTAAPPAKTPPAKGPKPGAAGR